MARVSIYISQRVSSEDGGGAKGKGVGAPHHGGCFRNYYQLKKKPFNMIYVLI